MCSGWAFEIVRKGCTLAIYREKTKTKKSKKGADYPIRIIKVNFSTPIIFLIIMSRDVSRVPAFFEGNYYEY